LLIYNSELNNFLKKNTTKKNNRENNTTEKLVIQELYRNPRISISTIAKSIGKTRQTVYNALKRIFGKNKIDITFSINKNIYNIKFIVLKLKVKKQPDIKHFVNMFTNCPRIFSILEFLSLNMIQIIIFIENYNNNFIFCPCPKIINEIHNDSRIAEFKIDPFCNLISPKFIAMMNQNNKKYKITPCKYSCSKCPNYSNGCPGCPGTIFYKKEFFAI